MIEEFITAMQRFVPSHARIMMCKFRGDPNDDIKSKWKAYVLDNVELIDPLANVYVCVSAMKENDRGEFRRRQENFAGGLLLMIDDLGSGIGAKFPLSLIDAVKPTALIETSAGNFQAIYMFDKLVTDRPQFEALIKAFIDAQFLGKDTGMAGINRVFRPPAGVNGKPKHNGWKVRMQEWNPECRYSVEQLAAAFKLDLHRAGPQIPRGATADKASNIREFIKVRQALSAAGMLKSSESDFSGWANIVCPWTGNHTGRVDNGAAIRLPSEENGWFGAFRCHHGSCEKKGWRALTDWLADEQQELLELINATANNWESYK